MRWSRREVVTRHGTARLHRAGSAVGGAPTVVLGHGAGGGIEAIDLQAFAAALVAADCAVVLVEQPWRVAGRTVAARPEALDEAWLDACRTLRPRGPLVVGGRSAGARVACRTAGALDAVAAVALAFPLHPPGRPERSRAAEIANCPVPVLVVQGDRDPFGSATEVRKALRRVGPQASVLVAEGGDHGLARADLPRLGAEAAAWVRDLPGE